MTATHDTLPFHEVQAVDVSKIYDRIVALRRVNFKATAGTITGIVGPNGAGKSTLFHILSTLVAPSSGRVLFDGSDVSAWQPRSALRGQIGMLGHQSFLYPDMTGEENLTFFGTLFGIGRADLPDAVKRVLECVRMDHAKTRRVKHCSRGMTQRLAFARVLLQDPTLWLLDEPTTGLDVDTRAAMLDIISSQKVNKRIVVVISHDPEALHVVADRVLRLDRGRIDDNGTGDT
ncbi:MAG: ABC transporter ATP-binding protein [Myxococcales bacterium]|nr:ABC transporter ATP-binding protein [Myxococcales bacterium]